MKLARWHVGVHVADMATAIADYRDLGAEVLAAPKRIQPRFFVPEQAELVDEALDVAWMRLGPGEETWELLAPVDPDGGGPQAKLLREHAGPSHLAYWCEDVPTAGSHYLERGAELVFATSRDATALEEVAAEGVAAVVSRCRTCSLRLPSGLVLELSSSVGRARVVEVWGEAAAGAPLS